MRYLIDPSTRSIAPIAAGSKGEITELLGCRLFDVAVLSNRDPLTGCMVAMYIDDEGRLIYPNPYGYFRFKLSAGRMTDFFCGKGIVHGVDLFGEEQATPVSLEQLKAAVIFPEIMPTADQVAPSFTITGF